MAFALRRASGRPSWMTPGGHEGRGDVFFDRLWPEWRRDMGEEARPSVNFYKKDDNYYLTADVPGLSKDEISVSLDDRDLTISGRKQSEKEEQGADYYMKERRHSTFFRSFCLPEDVDEEKVDATYKDGVLMLVMPIKEETETTKIKVH
jgi:HSP20 family protein